MTDTPTTVDQPIHKDKRQDNGAVSFGEKNVEALVLRYPSEVHESLRWLARFSREQCHSKLKHLRGAATRIGCDISESRIYKIFKGLYFVNEKGERVGSADNFIDLVREMKKHYSLSVEGKSTKSIPFIETETTNSIIHYIKTRRAPGRPCGFGIILGETGRQKTEACKELARRDVIETNGANFLRVIQSPFSPHPGKLLGKIACEFGDLATSPQLIQARYLRATLNEKHVIVIDNAQYLFNPAKKGNQPCFTALQELQEETGCCIILTILPGVWKEIMQMKASGYLEQFVGRAGGPDNCLDLEPFSTEKDIKAIARGVGLEVNAETIRYLTLLSRQPGRDRVLFDVIYDGQQAAKVRGEKLTLDHIRDEERTAEDVLIANAKLAENQLKAA